MEIKKPFYFVRGKWHKATKAEKAKYKKQFDEMRERIKHWGNHNSSEWIEINNSEGKNRLILASRDEKGNLGVLTGEDF